MEDEHIDSLDLVFVKRPDLRQEEEGSPYSAECSRNGATEIKKTFDRWEYWIDNLSLYEEQGSFSALIMPTYTYANGPADPIQLIEFFCDCHKMKVYPPRWVMDELFKRFSDYLNENYQGKGRRLGEYFGEPAGGGRSGYFRREVQAGNMEVYCANVHRLVSWFGRTKVAALDIVMIQLEREQADHPLTGNRPQGRESLRKAYQAWLRIFNELQTKDFWSDWQSPSNEKRTEFLNALGRDCLTGHPDLIAWLDREGTKKATIHPLRKGQKTP